MLPFLYLFSTFIYLQIIPISYCNFILPDTGIHVNVNFSEDFVVVVLNEWSLSGRCKACLSKTNTFGERQNFKGTLRFVMVSVICSRWFLLRPHEDAAGEVFLKTR